MNYIKIDPHSIANGPGVRVALFVSGCPLHCPECHNPEAWDFEAGQPFTKEVQAQIIQELKQPWIEGLTILGGEPLAPQNIGEVFRFCKAAKQKVKKPIWIYTGYEIDYQSRFSIKLKNPVKGQEFHFSKLVWIVDAFVDGPYIKEKRKLTGFSGSTNQRLIEKEGGVWTVKEI